LAPSRWHPPTEFFGEFAVILGTESFISIRALRPSRLMRVDPADLHLLITESKEAAAFMAHTLIVERSSVFLAECTPRGRLS
jgi:CRP-like cAMP-binding protein